MRDVNYRLKTFFLSDRIFTGRTAVFADKSGPTYDQIRNRVQQEHSQARPDCRSPLRQLVGEVMILEIPS
jgi:hypothetical protein